jgi:hypothetical protein
MNATTNASGLIKWASERSFFARRSGEREKSHLLLSGGVLHIPEDSSFEFLHQYATSVVRKERPSIVEVRPPVFRMFYDIDAHVENADVAKAIASGNLESIEDLITDIVATTADVFDTDNDTAVVCVANAPKRLGDAYKTGIHVTFDGIFATGGTARYARERVLKTLESKSGTKSESNPFSNPFSNSLEEAIDEAVFKGSGLRLPYSYKVGEDRVYVPVATWTRNGMERRLDPAEISSSVPRLRKLLARVSLRESSPQTKLKDAPDYTPEVHVPSSTTKVTHASLQEYSALVEKIAPHIPAEYKGNIVGVVMTDNVFMFRHSSKHCANVGREHKTSNTYFTLTREGLRQRCYSRKHDEPGREWGSCEHFRGDLIKIPPDIIHEAFPDRPKSVPDTIPTYSDNILERVVSSWTRPPRKRKKPAQKKEKTDMSLLATRW